MTGGSTRFILEALEIDAELGARHGPLRVTAHDTLGQIGLAWARRTFKKAQLQTSTGRPRVFDGAKPCCSLGALLKKSVSWKFSVPQPTSNADSEIMVGSRSVEEKGPLRETAPLTWWRMRVLSPGVLADFPLWLGWSVMTSGLGFIAGLKFALLFHPQFRSIAPR